MFRSWLWGLALLLAAGPTWSDPSPGPTPAEARLLRDADRVAAKVVALRGLEQRQPIRRGVMSKAQLKERLLRRVAQEYSPADLQAEEWLIKRFGLLPETDSYLNRVIELLTDQIAGFYDPWEKQLYLAGFQTAGGEMLMAHEIDHALQDQHFDLEKWMGSNKHEGDANVARQAVVEGDGMALMIEFLLAEAGQKAPWGNTQVVRTIAEQMQKSTGLGSFDKAPVFLRQGLVFPYVAGLGFVAHFRAAHPWSRIDAIYRKPPLSTEHILHPELYESYERPDEVVARPLQALAGLPVLHHDVAGEHGLAVWLEQHGVPRARARRAAAGWGGDRMAILGPKGAKTLDGIIGASLSVWDEEADAIEFYEAAREALASFCGTPVERDGVVIFQAGAVQSALIRRADQVSFVLAAPAASAPAAAAELSSAWTIKRR